MDENHWRCCPYYNYKFILICVGTISVEFKGRNKWKIIQNFQILWFVLILILFIGYSLLDGFDLGIGALLPFIAKTKEEKDILINSIGPVWDGNEVWLITGGGALFAAFPRAYATAFSGFYWR